MLRPNIDARLAQSVEHETLNLRVVGSSPTLGEYHFFCVIKYKLFLFSTSSSYFRDQKLFSANNIAETVGVRRINGFRFIDLKTIITLSI